MGEITTLPSNMSIQYNIRPGQEEDLPTLSRLLPELADFDVPANRDPADLWTGDGELLAQCLTTGLASTFVDVAENRDGKILGFIMVTLREELLSHAPSAHLETIIVAPEVRGTGLGRQLLRHAEDAARSHGARSLSLHVFRNNRRAHALYDAEGFDSELIRAIKWLEN